MENTSQRIDLCSLFCEIQTSDPSLQVSLSWPHVLPSSPTSFGGSSHSEWSLSLELPSSCLPPGYKTEVPLFLKSPRDLLRAWLLNQMNPKLSNLSLSHSFYFLHFTFFTLWYGPFLLFIICFTDNKDNKDQHCSKRPGLPVSPVPGTVPGMPACSNSTLKAYSFKVVLEVTHFSH